MELEVVEERSSWSRTESFLRGGIWQVFLVVRDRKPWFLVEVKMSETHLSPWLGYFQGQAVAPHAFQVVFSLPFEAADCFQIRQPVVVPSKTFLSQLL